MLRFMNPGKLDLVHRLFFYIEKQCTPTCMSSKVKICLQLLLLLHWQRWGFRGLAQRHHDWQYFVRGQSGSLSSYTVVYPCQSEYLNQMTSVLHACFFSVNCISRCSSQVIVRSEINWMLLQVNQKL